MKLCAFALVLIGVACNEASALKVDTSPRFAMFDSMLKGMIKTSQEAQTANPPAAPVKAVPVVAAPVKAAAPAVVVAPMPNEDSDIDAAFAAAIGQTHEDEELETEVVKATVGTVQLAEGGAAELASVKQALAAEQVASANLKIKIEKDQKTLLGTQKTAIARIRSLEAQLKAARAQCSGAPAALAAPAAPAVPAAPSAPVAVLAAPVKPVTAPVKVAAVAAPVVPAAPSVLVAPPAPVVVKAAPAIPVVAVAAPAAPVAAVVAPPAPVVVAPPVAPAKAAPVVAKAAPAIPVVAVAAPVAIVVAPPAPVVVAAPAKPSPPMAPPAGAPDMSAIMNLFAKVQTDAMAHTMKNNNAMRRLDRPTPPPRTDFRRHHNSFRGLVKSATKKSDE